MDNSRHRFVEQAEALAGGATARRSIPSSVPTMTMFRFCRVGNHWRMMPAAAIVSAFFVMFNISLAQNSWGARASANMADTKPTASIRGLTIVSDRDVRVVMTNRNLARLPKTVVETAEIGGNNSVKKTYEGPLLWTVLEAALSIHSELPDLQGRQIVLVRGRDGYVAALSLAEISPGFEGKQIILAEKEGYLQLIVPGDLRHSRDVSGVFSIEVSSPVSYPPELCSR
jgi:hypothetical protein